ncbi:D-alanine--D-alanine ligase [Pacificimonas sp. WHA3]|uniref:D-alanine--D-alanine ligase n=1 Tax=Pacificimonas pallii TaxID=2827236 RepID=A0ABS6SH83_9SPHN|nr:D-alanine--D-alanine ligase [Pacificimonas pallii]MBV7257207.1 D-alanine--D-alanine ligase [Pacificimonas pallii]
MKVAVLMGGWSAEREVSLMSGRGVAKACRTLGHETHEIDMDRDVAAVLSALAPDIVFNALHGVPGEDGTVQGMLDMLGLRYTHSGVAASVVAIDKELTKRVLVPAGIRMPEGRIVETESLHAGDPLPRPYVLKPVNEGSSVGIAIVTADSNYGDPIARDAAGPWQDFKTLLAEPFVGTRELTVAVLGDRPLAVTELIPTRGFYDFDAKYTEGLTEHRCPADLPQDVAARAMADAVKAHQLLGCEGVSRSDFRYDDQGPEGLYLLETNTQPGMTPLSLVPEQARHVGMTYEHLVQRIIDEALEGTGP